jgi:YD repeat-containing protein
VVSADNRFEGTASVGTGSSSVQVKARDYSGNERTNTYQIDVSGTSTAFTYDANGNLTADGARTFEWDAENRLVAVTIGTHRSEFTYDGFSRRVRIVEKDNAAVTSDIHLLWCGSEICEERDSTGATVTKRFFPQGEQQGTNNYFYTQDHLGSIRELVDGAGTVCARYDYDPFGRRTKVSGDLDTDIGYTGDYTHRPTGLQRAPNEATKDTRDLGRLLERRQCREGSRMNENH